MFRKATAIVIALLLIADPALAHHPMGGTAPTTFWHGLLSGLGHPVIGLDHLAAAIAVGCLAATQPKGWIAIAGYVIASVVGAAAHIGEATVPNAEVFVALSLVMLGLVVFRKNPLRRDIVFALFAGAGLINGYVLGETIATALRQPILGYLGGLTVIQFAIALAAMFGVRALASRASLQLLTMRVIGAFAVGSGAAILLQRYATGA